MRQFSLPQIICSLGGSSKIDSHVYFLLIVAMVLLLWRQIVLLRHQVTMIASEQHLWQNNSITQKTCNRKYTWLPFCYCHLVGILFEVLRIILMIHKCDLKCHYSTWWSLRLLHLVEYENNMCVSWRLFVRFGVHLLIL